MRHITITAVCLLALVSIALFSGCDDNNSSLPVVPANPAVTSFAPTSGPAGTTVTITGQNFSGATAVLFNGVPATSFTVVSATEISAVAPALTADGKITVTTPNGTANSTTNFAPPAAPTISSFTPTGGPEGTTVTITGENFTGATAVLFNGVPAILFTVDSATQITAIAPAVTADGKITVTTPNGTADSTSDFTPPAAPTITSFTPTFGPPFTTVTITGANFSNIIAVAFNGMPAMSFTVDSSTQITAVAPLVLSPGKITVLGAFGVATSTADFGSIPPP